MKMGGLCVLSVCLNLLGLPFKYTHKINTLTQQARGLFFQVDLVLRESVLALVFFCLVDIATPLNPRKNLVYCYFYNRRFPSCLVFILFLSDDDSLCLFFIPAGCPAVLFPAKVVQALNLNFDDMDFNGLAQPRLNSNAAFHSDYGKQISEF
jgi:hypothetical protein